LCTTKHQEVSNMHLDMHNTAYILCAILVTGVFGRKGVNPPECGVEPDYLRTHISGGEKVFPGQFPWLALLELQHKTTSQPNFCGATLITIRHLITAGHCVESYDVSSARLGAHDRQIRSAHEQVFLVKNVHLHEDYAPRGELPEQDLAILELDRDVQFSDWIYPICTPGFDDYYANNTAEVVGWGLTNASKSSESDVPKRADIKIIESNYRCTRKLGSDIHMDFGSWFCGESVTGNSCMGDSGGPLICRNAEEKFTICGVVSGGIGCKEEDQRASIYTRTHYYREWIQSNTEIDESCSEGYVCQSDSCPEFAALKSAFTDDDYEDLIQKRSCGVQKYCCKEQGSAYKSASYESFEPAYRTATLTWRPDGTSVTGSVTIPSSGPEGGEYRIETCGDNCHVLLRLDQTKLCRTQLAC